MFQTGIVILAAIVVVAFFVAGLSLTLIFKGRNIESEISTNRHMRERGITCAVADAINDQAVCDANQEKCSGSGCYLCENQDAKI